jgi:IclR family transcriptional regulator, acetate operon repressor
MGIVFHSRKRWFQLMNGGGMVGSREEASTEEVRYSIRSVQRVCDILDLLQESPEGIVLQQVAEVTGLPKSSAFRYLVTLESRRYVERADENRFRLGLAFLPLQARQLDMLAQRARPHLERLRDEFEETINLGLLDGNRVIYLDIVESPRSVRLAARRGDRDKLHATALGKAIAAGLPAEQVQRILAAEGLPRLTPRTITDAKVYFAELDEVRERGYAVDDGENEPDGRCVAVPIRGIRMSAALSLSAPASRFPSDRVELVASALQEVATKLAGDLSGRP